jgi:hypothetical protein
MTYETIRDKVVDLVGAVRTMKSFPYVTTADYLVEGIDKALDACWNVEPGDIGLSRNVGHLSNLFIPGVFKHAFIFSTDFDSDFKVPCIVEARRDGVKQRVAISPTLADYACILTPSIAVDPADRMRAAKKAMSLIGCAYDRAFEFDLEREIEFYGAQEKLKSPIVRTTN